MQNFIGSICASNRANKICRPFDATIQSAKPSQSQTMERRKGGAKETGIFGNQNPLSDFGCARVQKQRKWETKDQKGCRPRQTQAIFRGDNFRRSTDCHRRRNGCDSDSTGWKATSMRMICLRRLLGRGEKSPGMAVGLSMSKTTTETIGIRCSNRSLNSRKRKRANKRWCRMAVRM